VISGIEGIHAWYPPSGSGRFATNLAIYGTAEAGKGWGAFKSASITEEAAAYSEVWSYSGLKSWYVKLKATANFQTALSSLGSGGANDIPVVAGTTYTFSRRINLIQRGAASPVTLVNWYTAAGAFLATSTVEHKGLAVGKTRISATVTAPAAAARAIYYFGHNVALNNGETFECYSDMAQVEEGTAPSDDFPTASQLALGRAAFIGALHESASTLQLPAIELGRTKDSVGIPIWPRFELTRITGRTSLGEAESNRDRPVGAAREILRRSGRRGKTWAYEGVLKARSLVELREAEALFAAAFDDTEGEGRMDAFWHPLLLAAEPALAVESPKFFEAQALTADIIDSQDTRNFERPFVVGLRAGDRRYFDAAGSGTVKGTNTNTLYDFA
jgi:hypothetical protein